MLGLQKGCLKYSVRSKIRYAGLAGADLTGLYGVVLGSLAGVVFRRLSRRA
jgi:hypothetical protein